MNESEEKGRQVGNDYVLIQEDIGYENHIKVQEKYMMDINLGYIIDRELKFDGKQYLPSNFTDFSSLASPYKNEILEKTIAICSLFRLPLSIEEFKKDRKIQDLDSYLQNRWYFVERNGFVHHLCPQDIIKPSHLKYYKFFLPFVLRHCPSEDIPDFLYYHLDKYYKDRPQPFYSLLRRFLKERKDDFWYQENTESEVIDWLAQNGNKEEKTSRVTNGFTLIKSRNEFKNEDNMDNIMKVFDQLKYDGFLSRKTKLPQFRRIFKNVDQIENYAILNWEPSIGSLHFFIDELEQKAKIEKQQGKWIKCAQMFNVEGKKITPKSIAHNNKVSKKHSKMLQDIIAILD